MPTMQNFEKFIKQSKIVCPKDKVGEKITSIKSFVEGCGTFVDVAAERQKLGDVIKDLAKILFSAFLVLLQNDEEDDDIGTKINDFCEYFINGPPCQLLRSFLVRLEGDFYVIDGLTDALQKQLPFLCQYKTFEKHSSSKWVKFMVNIHLSEDKQKCYLHAGKHESLEKVLVFCMRASGYTEDDIISTIKQQMRYQSGPNAKIPSKEIDEILQDLMKFLAPEGEPLAKRARVERGGYKAYIKETQSPLHMASAFLYIPRTTAKLLEHFDINTTCSAAEFATLRENAATPIHLLIASLGIGVYDENCYTKVLETLMKDDKFCVPDYSGIQECIDTALHLSLPHLPLRYKFPPGPGRMELLFNVILKLVDHTSVRNTEFCARCVYHFVDLFRINAPNDLYQSTMRKLMRFEEFDINKRLDCRVGDYDSQKLNLFEYIISKIFHSSQFKHIDPRDPMVSFPFQEIITPDFDPSLTNRKGYTIVHFLLLHITKTTWKSLTKLLSSILHHPNCDVSLEDKRQQTPIDICINLYNKRNKTKCTEVYFFELVQMLAAHESMTSKMLHQVLCKIADIDGIDAQKESRGVLSRDDEHYFGKLYDVSYLEVVDIILGNGNFDINLQDKKTVVHVAAGRKNEIMIHKLVAQKDFQPNTQDDRGNTAIFTIVEYLPVSVTAKILCELKDKINPRIANYAGQKLTDLFEEKSSSEAKTLTRIMENHYNIRPERAIVATDPFMNRQPVDIASNQVILTETQSTFHTDVQKASLEEMEEILQKESCEVYDMKSGIKGKALIIMINNFAVPWLRDLNGYTEDKTKLVSLWVNMGFKVYIASANGQDSLTCEELDQALRKFGNETLEESDSCAVLCILSHGGDGFVYGRDGKKIGTPRLLRHLNNENCPQMMDKPKIVLLQACSGDQLDEGIVTAAVGDIPMVSTAASAESLPTISDTIIIHASQPGYVSFVYNTQGDGSLLVKYFIEVMKTYAAKEDILRLMTRVNMKVSDHSVSYDARRGAGEKDYKQMPEIKYSLRKLLYFFPLAPDTTLDIENMDDS